MFSGFNMLISDVTPLSSEGVVGFLFCQPHWVFVASPVVCPGACSGCVVSGPCPAGSVSPLCAPSLACLAVCVVDSGLSGLPSEWGCSPGGRQHNCSGAVPAGDVCAHLQFLLAASLSFLSIILSSQPPYQLPSCHRWRMGGPRVCGGGGGLHSLPGLPCPPQHALPRWACARWGWAVTHDSGLLPCPCFSSIPSGVFVK